MGKPLPSRPCSEPVRPPGRRAEASACSCRRLRAAVLIWARGTIQRKNND